MEPAKHLQTRGFEREKSQLPKNIKKQKKRFWSYLREENWPDGKTVAKTMQNPAVLKCAKKKNSEIEITVVNFGNKKLFF